MSQIKSGDTVRVKHDHSIRGSAYCGYSEGTIAVASGIGAGCAWAALGPASWFEKVPEPLEESVPIDVLRKALGEAYAAPGVTAYWDALFAHLRVLGYGKNND